MDIVWLHGASADAHSRIVDMKSENHIPCNGIFYLYEVFGCVYPYKQLSYSHIGHMESFFTALFIMMSMTPLTPT
jgi:hypothetical protein